MRPLLTNREAGDLQQRIADMRERVRARDAAERAAWTGTCYDCRDTGIAAGSLMKTCDCACGRALAAERLMAASRTIFADANIPPRCRDFTLDSYPSQEIEAYGKLQDFLSEWDSHKNLILFGSYGTGKTGLLVGALRAICDRYALSGRRVQFTTGADLLDELRHGYEDGTHNVTLRRVKTVALLAIDDLGAEKPSEWVLERLYVIVNARYEAMLPTFITTNYDLDELAGRIGERVFERLIETCKKFEVDGPNLRRRRHG